MAMRKVTTTTAEGEGRRLRADISATDAGQKGKKRKKKRCGITVLKWQPVNNHCIPENTGKLDHHSSSPKLSKPTTYKHDTLL